MAVQESILARVGEALARKGIEQETLSRAPGGPGNGDMERVFNQTLQGVTQDMAPQTKISPEIQGARLQGEHAVGTYAPESGGDAILGGLQSIRSMFDQQISRVAKIGHETSLTNAMDLIAAQAEVSKLTVMYDLGSKFAGKTVQFMDTVLKG